MKQIYIYINQIKSKAVYIQIQREEGNKHGPPSECKNIGMSE